MKITSKKLRNIIQEEICEAVDTHLSKARSKRYMQDAQPFEKAAFGRARRRYGKSEVEVGELDWLSGPIDSKTIGDIIPIGSEEWDRMSKMPGENNIPSERDVYLSSLAYDIVDGDVQMDDESIEKLEKFSKWFRDTLDSAFLQKTADDARYEWD